MSLLTGLLFLPARSCRAFTRRIKNNYFLKKYAGHRINSFFKNFSDILVTFDSLHVYRNFQHFT
jgi:hypothetical protein